LQLAHSFRLHGQVTTDFRDLPFDGIQQVDGPTRVSSPGLAYDSGLRHRIPSQPVS
jgi:hypothetical protein